MLKTLKSDLIFRLIAKMIGSRFIHWITKKCLEYLKFQFIEKHDLFDDDSVVI